MLLKNVFLTFLSVESEMFFWHFCQLRLTVLTFSPSLPGVHILLIHWFSRICFLYQELQLNPTVTENQISLCISLSCFKMILKKRKGECQLQNLLLNKSDPFNTKPFPWPWDQGSPGNPPYPFAELGPDAVKHSLSWILSFILFLGNASEVQS